MAEGQVTSQPQQVTSHPQQVFAIYEDQYGNPISVVPNGTVQQQQIPMTVVRHIEPQPSPQQPITVVMHVPEQSQSRHKISIASASSVQSQRANTFAETVSTKKQKWIEFKPTAASRGYLNVMHFNEEQDCIQCDCGGKLWKFGKLSLFVKKLKFSDLEEHIASTQHQEYKSQKSLKNRFNKWNSPNGDNRSKHRHRASTIGEENLYQRTRLESIFHVFGIILAIIAIIIDIYEVEEIQNGFFAVVSLFIFALASVSLLINIVEFKTGDCECLRSCIMCVICLWWLNNSVCLCCKETYNRISVNMLMFVNVFLWIVLFIVDILDLFAPTWKCDMIYGELYERTEWCDCVGYNTNKYECYVWSGESDSKFNPENVAIIAGISLEAIKVMFSAAGLGTSILSSIFKCIKEVGKCVYRMICMVIGIVVIVSIVGFISTAEVA